MKVSLKQWIAYFAGVGGFILVIYLSGRLTDACNAGRDYRWTNSVIQEELTESRSTASSPEELHVWETKLQAAEQRMDESPNVGLTRLGIMGGLILAMLGMQMSERGSMKRSTAEE